MSPLPCGRRIKLLSLSRGNVFAFNTLLDLHQPWFLRREFVRKNKCEPTMMCVACRFVTFWATKCNTPSIFRLADYLKDYSVPATICTVTFTNHLLTRPRLQSLNVMNWPLTLNTRRWCRTDSSWVLSLRSPIGSTLYCPASCIVHVFVNSQSLACLNVRIATARSNVGTLAFGYLAAVYLVEVRPSMTKRVELNQLVLLNWCNRRESNPYQPF